MPTLEFEGKAFVYSHHLSVPYRELIPVADKGIGAPDLDGNLIIHGDNLEALKALLPRHAGKVDVIYIDPPYNTGNEGWAYNDNVASPMIKEWLGKVVDREDLQRHDKWLCMMWPRLQLMRELLADDGIIFVSMDETEISSLYPLMDEVFGRANRFETLIWKKRYGGGPKEKFFVNLHEYILVYAKDKEKTSRIDRPLTPEKIERYYKLSDKKLPVRGPYRHQPLEAAKSLEERKDLRYEVTAPDGAKIKPAYQWLWEEDRFKRTDAADEIVFLPSKNGWSVQYKQYLNDEKGVQRSEKQASILTSDSTFVDGIYTQTGTSELKQIMPDEQRVPYPKPSALIATLLEARFHPKDHRDLLILDSFAGSGTTAHSVLAANHKDGGNRRFILIETEDYADTLTAERVRRVISGVPLSKDSALKAGLGGGFTYCDLGEPMDAERFFAGETAPSWEQVARYVLYTATGEAAAVPPQPTDDFFAAEAGGRRVHVIYKPDRDFLRSADAALTLELARTISSAAKASGKSALVFGAAQYVSARQLRDLDVTFAQLPWSVHQRLAGASA